MPESRKLPEPGSEELLALLGSSPQRPLYEFLFRRSGNPPTQAELDLFATYALGSDAADLQRHLRELRRYFSIVETGLAGATRLRLTGWVKSPPGGADMPISLARRAQVLAPQRCAQCGRTPSGDSVKLHVDYRLPLAWGGTSDVENLQPLCRDCIDGKRDYFQSFDHSSAEIRAAALHDEPQKRIGELLKAFDGKWVRADLIELVASAQEYQDDWQRRLRELRSIGWKITHQKRYSEGARVWTYYRLVQSAPWPENIHAAIKAEEQRRKQAKTIAGDS